MSGDYSTRWSTRRFTAFLLLLSFLAVLFSGVILYVTPRGRTANWTGWTLLGLDKGEWAAVHTTLSVIFLLTAVLHLWFNWRPLKSYLKGVAKRAAARKAEFALAAGILALTWFGTVRGWQPFVQLSRWNEEIKAWWEAKSAAAPVPHEEEAPLEKVAADYGLTTAEFLGRLRKAGLAPKSSKERLKDLAARHGLSAARVIERTLGNEGSSQPGAKGKNRARGRNPSAEERGGWGRMTLADLCRRIGIDLEDARKILAEKGVSAGPESKVRDLSRLLDLTPRELASLLGGRRRS